MTVSVREAQADPDNVCLRKTPAAGAEAAL